MGFSLDISVPALTVFLQGMLSFFSPCVLPLIPLYMGYLSGGTGKKGADGKIYYQRGKVMLHTFCFVIGVSFAFFVLGFGVSAVGGFLDNYRILITKLGGALIVLFGLNQVGIFGKESTIGKEHRLPIRLDQMAMSPMTALVMGFTFSFAWTPCVGPALTSVLLMAASAHSKVMGFALIGVYTLGFVLPFLAVGLFTTGLLGFFKSHMNVVKYTVKAGGVLMILMGVLMFTGKMNGVTGYLSGVGKNNVTEKTEEEPAKSSEDATDESDLKPQTQAFDFTLRDQNGNTHTLSDYKGKTVFLNFWATWCGPCRSEMPDIQKLYNEYSQQGKAAEVVILGVAAPQNGQEVSEEGIREFMAENGYTYPVVMDRTGEVFGNYGIQSFPTTFMIDKKGNVYGYINGAISEDIMRQIIRDTMENGER